MNHTHHIKHTNVRPHTFYHTHTVYWFLIEHVLVNEPSPFWSEHEQNPYSGYDAQQNIYMQNIPITKHTQVSVHHILNHTHLIKHTNVKPHTLHHTHMVYWFLIEHILAINRSPFYNGGEYPGLIRTWSDMYTWPIK